MVAYSKYGLTDTEMAMQIIQSLFVWHKQIVKLQLELLNTAYKTCIHNVKLPIHSYLNLLEIDFALPQ